MGRCGLAAVRFATQMRTATAQAEHFRPSGRHRRMAASSIANCRVTRMGDRISETLPRFDLTCIGHSAQPQRKADKRRRIVHSLRTMAPMRIRVFMCVFRRRRHAGRKGCNSPVAMQRLPHHGGHRRWELRVQVLARVVVYGTVSEAPRHAVLQCSYFCCLRARCFGALTYFSTVSPTFRLSGFVSRAPNSVHSVFTGDTSMQ
ncbi:hypothetical protein ERJ75_000123300 [Trypanosoma vivax]|nr:hypothetical protein ERJ75_000123300 [Trypanosoma vivax]